MKKLLKTAALAGGIMCAVNGLDNRLETTRYTVSSKKLPKQFDGFTIAHLSDLHSESIPNLSDAVKAIRPDIIACTGDMADDKGSYEPVISAMKELMDIAPVYTVTGNHDLWRNDFPALLKDTENTGAIYLRNHRKRILRNGASIFISGIDDPFSHDTKNINENIEYSLKTLDKADGFEILLFHRANLLDKLKDKGFDIILAGHMHGGQFRIPYVGGVLSPKSSVVGGGRMFFPKYFGGFYTFKNTSMVVSRGLGNPMIIPRIFNRPELIAITLKAADED